MYYLNRKFDNSCIDYPTLLLNTYNMYCVFLKRLVNVLPDNIYVYELWIFGAKYEY